MLHPCITEKLERKKQMLWKTSDDIWEHPELRFHETVSAETLCHVLEQEGFCVERRLCGIPTAFKATYGSGRPVIGILGEFDALDGLSQKADVFHKTPAGENPCGHGCGHHALGAGSLGAVIGIRRFLEETGTPGTVIYFGCPGEEGGSGKCYLVRDGAFDGVDCALTWHPCDTTDLFTGTTLAVIHVSYHFKGVSAHAAGMAHIGRSALDAVELTNIGANFLREHVPQETRIHYAITDAGGSSPNVVQANASVFYYLRSPDPAQLTDIFERMNQVARGAAMMTGTDVEIEYQNGVTSLLPNSVLDGLLFENLRAVPRPTYTAEESAYAEKMKATIHNQQATFEELLAVMNREQRQEILPHRNDAIYSFIKPKLTVEPLMFGSTDVSDVSRICPTAQIHVTTWAAGTQMHSWQAVAQGKSSLMHKGLLYAANVLACTAADLFLHPEMVAKAKAEFTERTGGEPFHSLMPDGAKPQTD